jgi:alkaline phosphatase D
MKLSPIMILFGTLCMGACASVPSVPSVPLTPNATRAPLSESKQAITRIAFGSCNKQELPQPLWRKLLEEKPELFIWTGDVVYADTDDMGLMSQIYARQLAQPEYNLFLNSGAFVAGVYDDHDYGANDGGTEFKKKLDSQALFLDFVNEPSDSPRRKQAGIYTSYRFGPEGKRLKVLLLDTRYHRQKAGPDSDILGAEQWAWLEGELRKNDAEVLLIVSSFQVLPFEHDFEKWGNFPKARERLLALLDKSPVRHLALLSGDRHFAELSRLRLPSGRDILEVTSSGMTHSYQDYSPKRNTNTLRVGEVWSRLNYGWIEIVWDEPTPHLTIQVRDINKRAVLEERLKLH